MKITRLPDQLLHSMKDHCMTDWPRLGGGGGGGAKSYNKKNKKKASKQMNHAPLIFLV
jgi:hypothetical protein